MPLTDIEKSEIQRLLEAQGDGRKFRDPEFLAESRFLAEDGRDDVTAWRRPRKMVEQPVLLLEGANSMDVTQGQLGDCWFLSAAAAVAQYPKFIRQIIPEDQHLYGNKYNGIVVFRFWRMGNWVSVYVDDRLPVDEDNALCYARCSSEKEFWLPLLEKAFAKFHGNYQNLDGGFLGEGLLALTGFIVEDIPMDDLHVRELHRLIAQELKNKSVITCATNETKAKGLVCAHAYTVTGTGRVHLGDSLFRLVRVRNPHASGEWQGLWSDRDPNWDEIDGQKLEDLGYKNEDDGQFWIKTSDFVKHFPDLTLAAGAADFGDVYETSSAQFYSVTHFWKEGDNAGGNLDNKEKFVTNPQYTLIIERTDDAENKAVEGEEDEEWENKKHEEEMSNVLLELIQEHDRSKYKELDSIGITIFKVEDPSQRSLSLEDLENFEPYKVIDFINNSSVVARMAFTPGTYIIIPSTEKPNINRQFLMRVYARKPISFLT